MHKLRLGADAMPAEAVLAMATINGAKVLAMADRIGSLEEGKLADVIILDDGGLYAAPMRTFEDDDVVKRLVSCYQSASVRTSVIDGRVVMEDRRLTTMDEAAVLEDGKKALADLWARRRAAEG